MPKFIPSAGIEDCFGSSGNITYFHRDGQCFYRKRPASVPPGTPSQLEASQLHRRALEAWRTLDPPTQKTWSEYATSVLSHRPPYDGTTHITGHNLFVSAYHGFSQLGDEHIPEPAPWEDFPIFSAVFDSSQLTEEGQLLLGFRVFLSDTDEPERYRLHIRADIRHVEEGICRSWPRVFVAGENCSGPESVVTVSVEDFSTLSGILTGDYKVRSKYLLIDTKIGYRCVAKRLSFSFSI
ncbi:MAG: hypothetical protein ACI3ZT_00965 [Candidatus Cryptobacteroides sp.]